LTYVFQRWLIISAASVINLSKHVCGHKSGLDNTKVN
jgi:hypothetical protein